MLLCLDVFKNISYFIRIWKLMDVMYNTERVRHTDVSGVTQPLGALRQSATFGPPLLHFGDLPPVAKKFRSVYHFGSQKIFPDIPQFFLNTKKIFRKHLKMFRIYDIFPETPEMCYKIFYGHFCRGPLKFGSPPSLDTLTPSRYATD
jgi:hypothetical protein